MIKDESDPELKEMAEMELVEAEEKIPKLAHELEVLLLPKDPNDDKDVIVEIRAGAGGDEAAIFVGDLYRMYCRYCDNQGWSHSMSDLTILVMVVIKKLFLKLKVKMFIVN